MGCVLEGFRLNHLAGLSQGGLEPRAVASLLVSETGITGRAEISAHHILLKILPFFEAAPGGERFVPKTLWRHQEAHPRQETGAH